MSQPAAATVRRSVGCWLVAVAAGVVETAIRASTAPDYDIAVQLPIRAAIYLAAIAVIAQLYHGRRWARIVLTIALGGLGLLSLLIEPVTWWAAGHAPGEFFAAADAPTLTVAVVRIVHIGAVLVALWFMYTPEANAYFRRAQEE
ncbi:hypothetical protein ACNQVK_29665 [Mycobacterium sp. 134]|uniref:hypothetical protein n=1 Tax=Mycobacterium sp. 134 TaxID=3400425 RepID=UPI003AB02AC2